MHYLGGKFRTAPQIVAILEQMRQPSQAYLEPFCGSCWVVANMTGKRIVADLHKDLVMMWGGCC